MPATAQIDSIVAVAGQNRGPDQASSDAGLEQFAIPVAVGLADQSTDITFANDLADGCPDKLKCLPITVGCEGITATPVGNFILGAPVAGAHPVDQLRCHAVALNRKRVVSIIPVDIIDSGRIGPCGPW